VKQPIVEMAMHASGMREPARVWQVSPTTGLTARKKRHLQIFALS
jgi:hypothetical protein